MRRLTTMTPAEFIFYQNHFWDCKKSRLKWSVPHTEKSDYNIITAKKASETIKSDNVRFDCSSRVQKSLIESRKKNMKAGIFLMIGYHLHSPLPKNICPASINGSVYQETCRLYSNKKRPKQ